MFVQPPVVHYTINKTILTTQPFPTTSPLPSLSLRLFLSLCLSVCLYLCLCLFLSNYLSFSHSILSFSLSSPFSLYLYLSLFAPLSHPLSQDYGQVSSWAVLHHQVLNMNKQRRENKVQIVTRFEGIGNDEDDGDDEEGQSGQEKEETIMSASDFWDQTFPQNVTVPWDK